MSFIDSELTEELMTSATMDKMEEVLRENGYNVTRTKFHIAATYGGTWSTNGKISKITVIDQGEYRICRDTETSKGYALKPNSGILEKLIQEAEFEPGPISDPKTGEISYRSSNPYKGQAQKETNSKNRKMFGAIFGIGFGVLAFLGIVMIIFYNM